MGFGEAISSVLKNYVNFSGRAARSEYWWWALFLFILVIATAIIDMLAFPGFSAGNGPVGLITTVGLLLPNIAVSIRRLHDLDRTGWWVLIVLTIIGIILLMVWASYEVTGTEPLRARPAAAGC